jgi:hypothetical protein
MVIFQKFKNTFLGLSTHFVAPYYILSPNKFCIVGEEHQGDFHKLWKKKKQVEIKEGFELRRKSKEDVRPQKYM